MKTQKDTIMIQIYFISLRVKKMKLAWTRLRQFESNETLVEFYSSKIVIEF